MAISLLHAFESGKSDGPDATKIQPSNWNDEHVMEMATARILGRKTASTGVVEELAADDVYDLLGIVGTTAALFAQTSAPTGWTKSATHNNKALRVVTGSVSSGGATAFTSVFGAGKTTGSYTLTTPDIPAHTHGSGTLGGTTSSNGAHTHDYEDEGVNTVSNIQSGGGSTVANDATDSKTTDSNGAHTHTITLSTGASGSAGGGGGHSHTLSLDLQYVDVIIATKD